MFYMFSGPDFLYADAFYSKATTYVLSALEPPGSVPDLTKLPRGGVGAALYDVEHSMGSILSFSFFITKQMKVDLRAGQLSGTLPILYVFLARSGKTIREVSPVALDDKGGGVLSPAKIPGKNATHGVRIVFAGSDGEERRCIISRPIFPIPASGQRGFLKFCETLAPGNSLIKSASYLLHSGNFTTVRDFLLANSATIIQDDSGIPLADYSPRKWRFFPFGRYAGPIDEFPGRYQANYAELFRRAQPMDFGIGYRWRSHESNLLLSVRLASDDPGGADATAAAPSAEPAPPKPPSRRRRARRLRSGRRIVTSGFPAEALSLRKTSPANALARHDEGCRIRRLVAAAQVRAGGDDHDDKCQCRDQIEVAGIVTSMTDFLADFPAH